ncbi:glucosamine-6-phosphate isomerase [Oceanobacillus oncorhynchi subsp. incaldanensis]|uniref:glucosamine-6-phosphate deaminase n=1 Tax=Oceanobacillus oncorhynchi TaxID=545501 RepID=UPI001B0202C6|nr:glucosamine-6-phosphate deaminase [Oceanobacillus oncorhynchi]GIO18980.1 glucosamine-6-phosphate isomerase [Oceanobacillus oncorhynchi subsp. incaldanensis]
MNIKKFLTTELMAEAAGKHIIEIVKKKPDSLLCFAGGDTPLMTLNYLAEAANQGEVDFGKCSFVSLDEWVGLGKETNGSCKQTLFDHFFDRIPNIDDSQICFFDGLAIDMDAECKRVDHFVAKHEGIDFMLLGIGMNGHIGFNEPGVRVDTYCHVIDLDPVTKKVSVKYFDEEMNVTRGISLGIQHITEAAEVMLMANGEKKADIVELTINTEPTADIPSTLVKNSKHAVLYIDDAAASKL